MKWESEFTPVHSHGLYKTSKERSDHYFLGWKVSQPWCWGHGGLDESVSSVGSLSEAKASQRPVAPFLVLTTKNVLKHCQCPWGYKTTPS
jgi:hypothetical protein